MTTDPPPPRRKWHFTRWLIVFIVAMFGWSGWQAYAFRSALAQAKALGWEVLYTDPVEEIRKSWRAAFAKATWQDGVTQLQIPTSDAFERHREIARLLNPQALQIYAAPTLRDLSALKRFSRLKWVKLDRCTRLTNIDALKDLPVLRETWIGGSMELAEANIAAVQSELPNVKVHADSHP